MKFLADENVPQTIIRYLRAQGYDTIDVKRTSYQGDSDLRLLAISAAEDRILISFDKDFVSPIYLPPGAAVVILHFPRVRPVDILPHIEQLIHALESKRLKRPYRILLQKESVVVLPE